MSLGPPVPHHLSSSGWLPKSEHLNCCLWSWFVSKQAPTATLSLREWLEGSHKLWADPAHVTQHQCAAETNLRANEKNTYAHS